MIALKVLCSILCTDDHLLNALVRVLVLDRELGRVSGKWEERGGAFALCAELLSMQPRV